LASNRATAAKTSHTLWIHTLSRTLSNHASSHLSKASLARLLQPTICFKILKALPFGEIIYDSDQSTRYDSSTKVGLTIAEIMLDYHRPNTPELDEKQAIKNDSSLSSSGLVLFSLHHNTPSASLSTVGFPTPPRKKSSKRSKINPDQEEDQEEEEREEATLFIPTTAHDLRFIRPGVEVWVWEPVQEVVLPALASSALEAEDGKEDDEIRRALLCSRFAFML
jgi:hypothetical protein